MEDNYFRVFVNDRWTEDLYADEDKFNRVIEWMRVHRELGHYCSYKSARGYKNKIIGWVEADSEELAMLFKLTFGC